ncbi:MAG: YbjN domain-containing protein [Deltaproteobacteria bacterium]|jgi:hypothetical protein|nr:YbjN domain-containing protein [Deltaproteobacteria bacterium]
MPQHSSAPSPAAALVALGAVLTAAAVLNLLCPPALASDPCRAYTGLNMESLGAVMRSKGYETQDLPGVAKNHGFMWTLPDGVGSLRIAEGGSSLHFYSAFVEGGAGFEKVNGWNRNFYFSRSYVDDDGDPGLYLDLNLEGGVCEDRILDFLATCIASDSMWREKLKEK